MEKFNEKKLQIFGSEIAAKAALFNLKPLENNNKKAKKWQKVANPFHFVLVLITAISSVAVKKNLMTKREVKKSYRTKIHFLKQSWLPSDVEHERCIKSYSE